MRKISVALAGRTREAILVGECEWSHRADSRRIRRTLEQKAAALPKLREPLRFAIGALKAVDNVEADIRPVTAFEIFQ